MTILLLEYICFCFHPSMVTFRLIKSNDNFWRNAFVTAVLTQFEQLLNQTINGLYKIEVNIVDNFCNFFFRCCSILMASQIQSSAQCCSTLLVSTRVLCLLTRQDIGFMSWYVYLWNNSNGDTYININPRLQCKLTVNHLF